MKINVNLHSSIQLDNIYIDPYRISESSHDAKNILITHSHYDHLSPEDIDKIINPSTVIIATLDAKEKLEGKYQNRIVYVKPYDNLSLGQMELEVLPAYNTNKQFHKASSNWVGYKIIYNGNSFAILGDTDVLPEHLKLSCDHLFIPIGGVYTMNAEEAAELTNKILPTFVTPVHYNSIVGSKADEKVFLKMLDKSITPKIYL